ncbi:hypothetical protein TNCV_2021711 [Trichonephila clavipes]|nr:hypothetical protein TNCV_2021711 [Trichonephila clavipes]
MEAVKQKTSELLKALTKEDFQHCFDQWKTYGKVLDSPLRQKHDKFQGLGLGWPGRQYHMLLVISRDKVIIINNIFQTVSRQPCALWCRILKYSLRNELEVTYPPKPNVLLPPELLVSASSHDFYVPMDSLAGSRRG